MRPPVIAANALVIVNPREVTELIGRLSSPLCPVYMIRNGLILAVIMDGFMKNFTHYV